MRRAGVRIWAGERMRGQTNPVWIFASVAVCIVAAVLAFGLRGRDAGQTVEPMAPKSKADANFPRTLETTDGEVLIPSRPERIVSQTLFTDEVLLAICTPERIAGIHRFALSPQYSHCIPEAKRIEDRVVEGAEAIVALAPDLIFVSSHSRAEIVDQLRAGSGGAIVRFSKFDSLNDIRQNIRDVGYAIGEDAAAKTLIAEMDERIASAVARIPSGSGSPGVVSYGTSSSTAGKGTLFDDIARTVGARNLAAENGVNWFGQVGVEQIGSWDPDAIVCGAGPEAIESIRTEMLENPVFAATKAGRNGRIVVLENRVFLAASHHVASFVEALVEELFLPPPEGGGKEEDAKAP